jgi:hypothetical protein
VIHQEEMERKRAEAIKKASALRKESTAAEAEAAAASAAYDEDGLRTKWDSAPSAELKDLRRIWLNTDLKDKIRWTQGQVHSSSLSLSLPSPPHLRSK